MALKKFLNAKRLEKFLDNCYAALIWNREKCRAVVQVLFSAPPQARSISAAHNFLFVEGFYDMDGIDWGTYMLTHNMPEKVAALRHGLDEKSNKSLDLIFSRMILFPQNWWRQFKVREAYIRSFLTPEEMADEQSRLGALPQYRTEFLMDEPTYACIVFTCHTGLRNKSEKLKKYIAGKDFIDGGAYIGDTALVYMKYYAPRKVYSFEISEKTCMRYENVMRMNNIAADQYQLCRMGLSDKKSTIMMHDSGHQGTTVLSKGTDEVQLTDLDSFAQENHLNVGFIKADLEGSALECTLGMKETIKRDRPVIAIDIYHSPKEFFEVKPALDEITAGLNYKITIEKNYTAPHRMVEAMIFAYPKELDDE